MKRIKVNLDRAKLGNSLDLVEHYWDLHQAGMSWDDAASTIVAEKAVERYQSHLAAAFRRYGIPLPDGGAITVQVLLEAIENKTGLTIAALSPQAVLAAVDGQLTRQLSDYVGAEFTTVTNPDAIKAALIEAAKQAVASGRATKLISKATIDKVRKLKAFKDLGVVEPDQRAVMNRVYQKTFRRRFKEVWIGSKGDPGWDQSMYDFPRDT